MRVDFEGGAGCRAHIPSLRRLPVAHQIFYSLIFVSSYLCMQHVSNLKSTCGPHTGKHLRCHSFSSAVSTIQVIIWSTESGDQMKVQLHKLDLDALNTFDCCHPSINADCFYQHLCDVERNFTLESLNQLHQTQVDLPGRTFSTRGYPQTWTRI